MLRYTYLLPVDIRISRVPASETYFTAPRSWFARLYTLQMQQTRDVPGPLYLSPPGIDQHHDRPAMRRIHIGSPNRQFINRLTVMESHLAAANLLHEERSLTWKSRPQAKEGKSREFAMYFSSFIGVFVTCLLSVLSMESPVAVGHWDKTRFWCVTICMLSPERRSAGSGLLRFFFTLMLCYMEHGSIFTIVVVDIYRKHAWRCLDPLLFSWFRAFSTPLIYKYEGAKR